MMRNGDGMTEIALPPETIHCGQVTLRRTHIADADALATAVAESLEHLRPFIPWATDLAGQVDAQRERLTERSQAWERGETFDYLVLPAGREEPLLGAAALHRRVGPGGLEIGYWTHVAHTRRGYVTTAAKALTDAALALPDITRVEIHIDVANTASSAVPRKLGYRLDREEPFESTSPAGTGTHQIWVYP
jgi:RimJ/RimL family protein N-acetyltransferase